MISVYLQIFRAFWAPFSMLSSILVIFNSVLNKGERTALLNKSYETASSIRIKIKIVIESLSMNVLFMIAHILGLGKSCVIKIIFS